MAKKKVCKKCKIFVQGEECPLCKSTVMTNNWKGRINVLDAKKSLVADKVGIDVKGEYAIKVR